MKYLLYLTTLLAITACVAAPRTTATTPNTGPGRYEAFVEEGHVPLWADYTTMVTQRPDQTYIFHRFFPETMQMTERYEAADRRGNQPNGHYESWWDNGNKRTVGQYLAGKQTGDWKNYNFSDGNLFEEGAYTNGQRTGKWTRYDGSQRKQFVTDYANGAKSREMKYDSLGMLQTDFRYAEGEIVEVLKGEKPGLNDYQLPLYKGCEDMSTDDFFAIKSCADRKMLEFIYSNIRYPNRARQKEVEGMALATFVVEKSGEIADVEIMSGLNEDISREVMRVISLMPAWNPGTKAGEPVRVQFNLPVKFKLE